MKIDGFGSITSTNSTSKRRNTSAAGAFADLLAAAENGEAPAPSATSETVAPASLSSLLALQEMPEELLQRKKLVQQGNNMLDVLEKLRRQLLNGSLTLSVLQDIEKQISQQKQIINDPQLMSVIDDIELRAAVELAKLQMSMAKDQ